MNFYIYFFLITWLGFYFSYTDNKREKYYFFLFIFISIVIFSLRYQVGGDWKRYQLFYDEINASNNFKWHQLHWSKKESLHFLIQIVTKQISDSVNLYYFIMSIIFFLNLMPFFIKLKYPLLSLTISLPFSVYLLHLGLVRQSVALSFILMSFYFLISNKKISSLLLFFIGVGFHTSIIVFFPIYIYRFLNIYFEIKTKIYLFLLLFISLTILAIFTYINIESIAGYFSHNINQINFIFFNSALFMSYIYENTYASNGVYIRFIPSYVGFLILLFNYNQFTKTNYIYFVDFGLILFIFVSILLVSGFSTGADRLNYYLLPSNLIAFIYFCTHNKSQLLLRSSMIVFMHFLILLIWLNFSDFSQSNWQPFKTYWHPFKTLYYIYNF